MSNLSHLYCQHWRKFSIKKGGAQKIVLTAIHKPLKLEKSFLYENGSKFNLQCDGEEKHCKRWQQKLQFSN